MLQVLCWEDLQSRQAECCKYFVGRTFNQDKLKVASTLLGGPSIKTSSMLQVLCWEDLQSRQAECCKYFVGRTFNQDKLNVASTLLGGPSIKTS